MRLPRKVEDGLEAIDELETIRMVRCGIDAGINYVDLGFPWDVMAHEPIVRTMGRALGDGYRHRVKMALTIPARLIRSLEDFDRLLETQLAWSGFESADFCLVGRLTRDNWPPLLRMGILDRLERALGEGLIGHAGFSFHDHYQVLKSIVQAYDRWTLCSVGYTFMDANHDPGANGIMYAAGQGLAVVATQPFKGGRLTKEPPEEVRLVWARSPRTWSYAEWALRFVLNHPGVSVAVSSMSSTEQLLDDLRVADVAEAASLGISDEITISNVRDAFRRRQKVPCPSCRACMPCPAGIDVPRFFEIYNDAAVYDDVKTARLICAQEQIRTQDCTECGLCESNCAKRLPIVDWLKRASELFT
jgi:predicted aldo/keto reductase-like oxidoreductase